MMYLSLGLSFIILQTILIATTNFNVWPEIYFFPWLVQKGLLPYRDFFDHHGFLLYYLLLPFSSGGFSFLKIVYSFVLSVNFLLILAIIKKLTTKLGFAVSGILAVLLNFFIGENNFWYETVIVTFYLTACLLLISKNFRAKSYAIGILIALASFIKPIAGIVLLPVFIIKKDLRLIVAFIGCWLVILLYFFINHAFEKLIENLFLFNNFLIRNYYPSFFSDQKFLLSSFFVVLFSIFLSWKNKQLKKCIYPLVFLISSLIFLSTGYDRTRILPVFTFFPILVSLPFSYKNTWQKMVFVFLLVIYMAFLGRKVLLHQDYLNSKRTPWLEDKRIKITTLAFERIKTGDDKIYIVSNHPEIYVRLNQLPPTYFPIKFPLAERYFSDYEERLISNLKKNRVTYVITPKPVEEEYLKLEKLREFIEKNYFLVEEKEEYEIRINSLIDLR